MPLFRFTLTLTRFDDCYPSYTISGGSIIATPANYFICMSVNETELKFKSAGHNQCRARGWYG